MKKENEAARNDAFYELSNRYQGQDAELKIYDGHGTCVCSDSYGCDEDLSNYLILFELCLISDHFGTLDPEELSERGHNFDDWVFELYAHKIGRFNDYSNFIFEIEVVERVDLDLTF